MEIGGFRRGSDCGQVGWKVHDDLKDVWPVESNVRVSEVGRVIASGFQDETIFGMDESILVVIRSVSMLFPARTPGGRG